MRLRMRSRFIRHCVPAAAAALALGSCLEAPSGPRVTDCGQIYGNFEGRAAGAKDDTVAGCSYYTISNVSGAFGMVLTNGGPLSDMPMLKVLSTSLPIGQRIVGSASGQLYGVVFLGSRRFTLTSGSMSATAQDGNWGRRILIGRLDISATEDEGGATIRLYGDFTSGCVGQLEGLDPVEDRDRPIPPICAIQGAGLRQ